MSEPAFKPLESDLSLVDVSIFFFFCSGRGKGESEAPGGEGGGGRFFIENTRRGGGGFLQEGEGPRGREGVCSEVGILGGGAKYFIFWAEMSAK